MNKSRFATLGLIFITVLAAIQYVFLINVPDTVSTFSFMCITNVIGFVILGITQFKKILTMQKKTWMKGALFALELCGFNFFLLMGSRNMDSVIISSVVSMYFIFITPLLLLLKKRVNFLSGIASVVAVIALLLMFGAETDKLFSSANIIYLFLADIFFAAYVVSISLLGEDEDSVQLTMSQMIFSVVFAFAGWIIESILGYGTFSLPKETNFWISALFIGVCIRAAYSLIQITCQKYVPALNASLIFSSEIIFTLLLNPIMCRLFGDTPANVTVYQVIGCVLFLIATLLVDDNTMSKVGFETTDTEYVNENGETVIKSSVSKKITMTTLTFTMISLVISTIVCLAAINFIKDSAVENSASLGVQASKTSENALTSELEIKMQQLADDKAKLAEAKLNTYSFSTKMAASYATTLLSNPDEYGEKEVLRPIPSNGGIWAMQRCMATEDMEYAGTIKEQSLLLGNMIDVFEPIIRNNENIATIYMGTEEGLLISYDIYSDSGDPDNESYYNYFESDWYNICRDGKEYAFTETYQDAYGRGLTITCVSPFYDKNGEFMGCVAMDILMKDLNESMVNDSIIDPNTATMIDAEGNVIASKDIDPLMETVYNIFDPAYENHLAEVGHDILKEGVGLTRTGEADDEIYIAYSHIESTDWTLCILSPVYAVIEPAVQIRDSIDANTENVVNSVAEGIMKIVQNCLVLSAIILLTITMVVNKSSKRISDPLKQLESDVNKISRGSFDQRTSVATNDEIGSLADSFNLMTDALQRYIVDLKDITAKEERIASELVVATDIQASMLPNKFPAFPNRKDFDIFADMNPAKEVGGDFYDFFMIDDNHLALVMADVSGKGVPAALFMVNSMMQIRSRAMAGGSPAEILYDVNNTICETNDAGLFVTVWLAILDLTTGIGMAANAGHEHPTIRRGTGEYELVVYRHSSAVGCMQGMKFREHEFEVKPGDSIFVYTDGLPEATNAEGELFGNARMMEALNVDSNADMQKCFDNIKDAVAGFVKEAEQFDDLTMLRFDYYGSEGK